MTEGKGVKKTNPRRVTLEAGVGAVVFLVACFLVVWTRSYVLQVLAVGLGLLGLKVIWEWATPFFGRPVSKKIPFISKATREILWGDLLREGGGPLLVVVLTLTVYWPLAAGYMPWMADHTVHQLKAYIMAEHLIPSGRIMGWSMFSGAGYPAEQLYPLLGDLWVSFVRYATLKSLSWEATYAWALLGVLFFVHLVPYYLGRRLYGPVAGLVFSLFVMTDMGGFREGGFVFTVRYGVWPLALGVSFSLLALERLVALRNAKGFMGVASFAVMAALALLSHPIALVFLFLTVPSYALYEHLWNKRSELWLKGIGGLALGVGLSAFWFVPYLAQASDFSSHVSNLWKSFPEIAQGIVGGNLYEGSWSWSFVLGVLGLLAWVVEKRPVGRFLAALSVLLLAAASLTVYGGTGVENWLGSIRHMQFQRFVIYIKMLLFLAGGALVQRLFFGLRHGDEVGLGGGEPFLKEKSDSEEASAEEGAAEEGAADRTGVLVRCRLRQLVAFLVVAPLVTSLAVAFWKQKLAPLSNIQTRKTGVGFYKDLRHLLSIIKKREGEKGGRKGSFFRVAYWTGFNDHSLANGPVLGGHPHVKCSFIPSETYKYLTHVSPSKVPKSPKDFEVLNVKYILANKPLPHSLRKCPVVAKSGGLTLYEFPGYRSQRATLLGPGKARVVAFSDEEIRVKVSGTSGKTTPLVLHVPYFAQWSAHQGGQPLAITTDDTLAPHVPGLMKVKVKNGEVMFRYFQGALGWVSKILSFLSLLLCLAFYLIRREVSWAVSLWRPIGQVARRFQKPLGWCGYAFLIGAVLFVAVKWISAPDLPKQGRSLTWDLSRARVYIKRHDGGRTHCRFFLDGRFFCGSKSYQYVGPISEEWGLKNRRGLWAHPHAEGILVIEYPDVLMGKELSLDYGLLQSASSGRSKVYLTVYVGDEELARVTRSRAGWSGTKKFSTARWKGKKATVRFEVSAKNIGARHFVFDAVVLP